MSSLYPNLEPKPKAEFELSWKEVGLLINALLYLEHKAKKSINGRTSKVAPRIEALRKKLKDWKLSEARKY